MNRNIAIGVLAVAALAALGFGMSRQGELARLKAESAGAPSLAAFEEQARTVARLEAQLQEQAQAAATRDREQQTLIQQLSQQMEKEKRLARQEDAVRDALEARRAAQAEIRAAAAAAEAEKKENADAGGMAASRRQMLSEMAKAMRNPEMKKMMRAQQKGMMDVTYDSLEGLMDLSAEDFATFKDKLIDRQMEMTELGIDLMDTSLSDEEKAAKRGRLEDIKKRYDEEIASLLGAENNEVFRAFEETQGERMQVSQFNQSLAAERQLDELKQNELIFAMRDVRNSFDYTTSLRDRQDIDPSQITPDEMSRLFADTTRLHEQYIAAATPLLTADQLAQYRVSLEQQRAMQEMGMRMMFGDPAGDAANTAAGATDAAATGASASP
jgi:hypothetical protein